MNFFYAVIKKHPLECVFVYNSVSPNVSLFLAQACSIFCDYFHVFALNTNIM